MRAAANLSIEQSVRPPNPASAGEKQWFRAAGPQAGGRSFAYDQADRLLETTLATETTGYRYDGDGKRLRAGQTSFLWDIAHPLPQLALERDPAGATLRRYGYGNELLSMRTAGEERYLHTDALGSTLNTSSSTGKLEWSYSYEPYGSPRRQNRHSATAADNPVRYTGAYQDPTGLYHLRARQYDPANGRFTSTDPLAPVLSDPYVSSYVYANNRPTALIDPSGMGAVRTNSTSGGPYNESSYRVRQPCADYRTFSGKVTRRWRSRAKAGKSRQYE